MGRWVERLTDPFSYVGRWKDGIKERWDPLKARPVTSADDAGIVD